ncbi:MAG: hypothetical protein Q9196_003098 [Gyalolechia fulgens]
MADPLSISLRAWPPQDKSKESVPYLISRINGQRGSFRNITEASLEEEVRSVEAGEVDTIEGTKDEPATEDGQDATTKGDDVVKAREEIIKQISAATRASTYALEFVSLLLSRYASKAAESTISPSLRAIVPMGSIGAEIMQERPRSQAEKTTEALIGLGWRMQSLARSADSLLKSASRLEQEMARETTYWQEILAAKESGWSLCRLPGEGHTLGVRFGFGEANRPQRAGSQRRQTTTTFLSHKSSYAPGTASSTKNSTKNSTAKLATSSTKASVASETPSASPTKNPPQLNSTLWPSMKSKKSPTPAPPTCRQSSH